MRNTYKGMYRREIEAPFKDGKRGKRARRETLDRRRARAFVRGKKGH